ncbi:MAG TPA: SMC family ATPase [Chthonomonadaceae bacterium]|nr:SMC family ATPase [Chthonomonadaceae bacterium]
MHICKVEVDNFKSHVHSVVEFKTGTNAISGPNWAGKTSLVQAVGLALFDYCGSRVKDYIRAGEREAAIRVTLVSSLDEREYQVTRRLRSSGATIEWSVSDPELGQTLVSGEADVKPWLCDHLGLRTDVSLHDLFEYVVGTPQGEMTSAFTERAGRAQRFNALLRIEEYRTAFENLLKAVNHLKDQISDARASVTRLEGETVELPEVEKQCEALMTEIGTLEEEIQALESQVADLRAQSQGYEAIKAQLDILDKKIGRLKRWLAVRNNGLANARHNLIMAEKAEMRLVENAPGHRAYEAAESELTHLRHLRAEKYALVKQRDEFQVIRIRMEAEINGLRSRLTDIESTEAEAVRLTLRVQEQQQREQVVRHAEEQLNELQADLRVAKGGRKLSGDGLCPFLKETCRNLDGSGRTLTQFFDARLLELEEAVSGAQSALTARQRELAALGEAPNDPRTLLAVAQHDVESRPEVERQMNSKAGALASLDTKIRDYDAKLEPLKDVESDIERWEEVRRKNTAAHNAWLIDEATAAQVATYRDAVGRLEASLNCINRMSVAREAQHADVTRGYDAEAHTRLLAELDTAKTTQAAKTAAREEKQRQKEGMDARVNLLRHKQEELNAVRAVYERLLAVQKHLEFIRKAIRDAGPHVNELLVQRISDDAQILFRGFIGDPTLGLRWESDYEIVLMKDGRERGLAPAAGSERVAAVLAIRLALMQHMGEIRLVFFDEPTIHLDETRREYLVQQLMGLRFFHQLFVISHDDTFEKDTDYVVRVESQNGRSIVTTP